MVSSKWAAKKGSKTTPKICKVPPKPLPPPIPPWPPATATGQIYYKLFCPPPYHPPPGVWHEGTKDYNAPWQEPTHSWIYGTKPPTPGNHYTQIQLAQNHESILVDTYVCLTCNRMIHLVKQSFPIEKGVHKTYTISTWDTAVPAGTYWQTVTL